ncbi:histidine kinase [Frankia sp. Cr2]|uniref:histidine kinase n=1 Tax=Frankia sp. Cr2 TaxID=3073932 RepID=UPI002AD3157C|nr:histidine kinase [Frankia sp. Cr2]
MSVATESRAGWAVAGVSACVLGFWLVLGGLGDVGRLSFGDFVDNAYSNIVFGLAFPVVGTLILSRRPGHRLGWLYCLCGLASSVTLAAYSYAQRGLVDGPGLLPGALAAGWVSSWIWLCGVSPLVTFGVLWFPDGRLPSRRWWPVQVVAGLAIGLGVAVIALRPGPLENASVRDNPLGLPLPRSWFGAVSSVGVFPVLLVAVVGGLAAAVVRYRRGSTGERDQLRWFLVAVLLIVVTIAPVGGSTVGVVHNLFSLVAIPLLPLSVGVAVLRHRLDGVEVAVRRSLVYGWLIAAGLAVYAAVVLVLQAVLRGHAEPAVTLAAAGAVAVLYQPLRLRLERSADRMLYGDRGNPYAVLVGLGRRLQAAGSAEHTLPETVGAIASALRLPYVAVELPGDPPAHPTAVHGTSQGSAPVIIPLAHGGADVGRLVVARRGSREDLTPAERRLLDDLGSQVAVAAHAVLLDRALRRSRERLVVGREEERRRLRRELHDGLGPALAGVALGVDAARNMLRADPHSADALLADLKDETLGCVGEVRRIVEDLRPPALDELGLLPALAAFVDRLSTRDDALRVAVQSPDPLPPLPAAVEVAAYRIATEAITNVARHAHARSCLLRLDVGDDLTVEVRDDGVGVPAAPPAGVGLASMAERAAELGGSCVVARLDGGGTRVMAHLPLAAA